VLPWKGSSPISRNFAVSNESGSRRSANRRFPRSRLDPITPSRCETCSSASWKSRRPAKAPTRAVIKGHDKEQWEKLQSLPNLLYTDGNSFSLWHNGELVGSVLSLQGDVETSGEKLAAPSELVARFDNFLRWEPIPPKSAAELAKVSARLCRLLRDEVTEQLAEKSPALTALAADWRKLLFPEAVDRMDGRPGSSLTKMV
jgi:hypothetical protein